MTRLAISFIFISLFFVGCSPIKNEQIGLNQNSQKSSNANNVEGLEKSDLRNTTYTISKNILEIIEKTEGLTPEEIETVKGIKLEVFSSSELLAYAEFKNGQNVVSISTAFLELVVYLTTEINPFEQTGDKACILAIEGLSRQIRKRLNSLDEIFQNFNHDCNHKKMTEMELALLGMGYLFIPIAHEVAHILRGDVYQRRDEKFETVFMIEHETDRFAAQIIGRREILLVGLTSFLFFKNEKLRRGSNNHYLPIMCRARILSYHFGGLDKLEYYHRHSSGSSGIIKSDMLGVLIKHMYDSKNIGGGFECPD